MRKLKFMGSIKRPSVSVYYTPYNVIYNIDKWDSFWDKLSSKQKKIINERKNRFKNHKADFSNLNELREQIIMAEYSLCKTKKEYEDIKDIVKTIDTDDCLIDGLSMLNSLPQEIREQIIESLKYYAAESIGNDAIKPYERLKYMGRLPVNAINRNVILNNGFDDTMVNIPTDLHHNTINQLKTVILYDVDIRTIIILNQLYHTEGIDSKCHNNEALKNICKDSGILYRTFFEHTECGCCNPDSDDLKQDYNVGDMISVEMSDSIELQTNIPNSIVQLDISILGKVIDYKIIPIDLAQVDDLKSILVDLINKFTVSVETPLCYMNYNED